MKENTVNQHPQTSSSPLAQPVLVVFAHLNAPALGTAIGLVSGLWIFLATAILLIRGGDLIGPRLGLLGQYFPGYTVTWPGVFLGFLYGFVTGFIFGYVFASMRNAFLWIYVHWARRRAQQAVLGDLP